MSGSFGIINLPGDILDLLPIAAFKTSKNKLSEAKAPTGADTGGMPAAQDLLALFSQFQDVLSSYSGLVDYDCNRMAKVVSAFIATDSGK